ncbi:MAG: tRNA (adenosine(37)-N6)-threonylcarbamoyltransferase complex ATPase subunit type 1 TsaE [Candidatus Paceibacterota bacterium]
MTTVSESELQAFVEHFLEKLVEKPAEGREGVHSPEHEGAVVVALSGDLGAGKTTFTQTLARTLGVETPVTSPTFVIEQVYHLPGGKQFDQLVHIDAYRLESGEELVKLGWNELTADPNNLVVVEWGEKVREIMPDKTVWLKFEVVGGEERKITTVPVSRIEY